MASPVSAGPLGNAESFRCAHPRHRVRLIMNGDQFLPVRERYFANRHSATVRCQPMVEALISIKQLPSSVHQNLNRRLICYASDEFHKDQALSDRYE